MGVSLVLPTTAVLLLLPAADGRGGAAAGLRRAPAGARRQSAACAAPSSRGRRVLVLLPEREGLLSERALLLRGVGEGSGAAVMKRILPSRGVAAALVIALVVSGRATLPRGPSVMVLPGSTQNVAQFQ